MSKKKLLQEGTVRKFMKLSGLESLSGDFVNEQFDVTEAEEAEEKEEVTENEEKEEMDDMPMDDEPMGDEPMDDMPMDDEPIMGGGADNEELLKKVVDAVAAALDVEVTIDGEPADDDMPMDDMPMDDKPMDDEPAMDMPADEPAMDMPMDDEKEELDELSGFATEALVAELEKRGAATLEEEQVEESEEKEEDMMQEAVERIASNVAARLLKK